MFEEKDGGEQLNDNKYARYQEQSINTATPQELTLMLYNGCIKFINLARLAIDHKDIEQKNLHIQKAESIIEELNITLNMEYELSQNLRSLYDFIYRQLVQANIDNDKELLEYLKELVTGLRDTWREAMLIANKKSKG